MLISRIFILRFYDIPVVPLVKVQHGFNGHIPRSVTEPAKTHSTLLTWLLNIFYKGAKVEVRRRDLSFSCERDTVESKYPQHTQFPNTVWVSVWLFYQLDRSVNRSAKRSREVEKTFN